MKPKWSDFVYLLETETDLTAPTRLDVAVIEALMIWPDDENNRARAATASFVEYIGDFASELPRELLAMHQKITRRADSIDTIQDEIRNDRTERIKRGAVAGSFLYNVIKANALNLEHRSMESVTEKVIAPFVSSGSKFRRNTFNNQIWSAYRRVAHFWAAWFSSVELGRSLVFPCHYIELREFLSDAEAFRILAKTPGRLAHRI